MEKVRVVIQRNKKVHWPWIIFLSNTRLDYHQAGQNGFYQKAWPGSGDHLKIPIEQLLIEGCELVSDTIIEVTNLPEHFPFGFPLIHESGIQNEWYPTAGEADELEEQGNPKEKEFMLFEFDSPECAAVAHDLAEIQMADGDRDELNFSVDDLEILMGIARGGFDLGMAGDSPDEKQETEAESLNQSGNSKPNKHIIPLVSSEDLRAIEREHIAERKKIKSLIKDGKTELAIETIEKSQLPKWEWAGLKALATAEATKLARAKEAEDGLYQQAIQLVLKTRNARNAFLRHRLKISQNKATAIIERMTEEKILGQYKGSNKPREILK